jgi:cyclase
MACDCWQHLPTSQKVAARLIKQRQYIVRKRLIPVLLLDRNRRLVKTVAFGERTYVGDPFNVIRLFNEKEVDELCVLDIDASREGRRPDFGFLRELASECFMPLSYGGGIVCPGDCERLNRDGVEKFILGRCAFDKVLVTHLSATFGSQAIVACVDVKGSGDGARCMTTKGPTDMHPVEYCLKLEKAGVGEIIVQSVDRDGQRDGYDLHLISLLAPRLRVPLVALGGAGQHVHLSKALRAGASAAASGSVFTFIGRLRAVLVSYPNAIERQTIEKESRS